MPRYVILWHETGPALGRPSHFDLLLEEGPDARAWCIEQEITPNQLLTATELPRHRLHYLTYEGPISGNRGTVTRWDWGEYRLLESLEHRIRVEVTGQRLVGAISLDKAAEQWQLRYLPSSASESFVD
jgi:DNA polymerase Ligase (LigD)